MQLEEHWQKTTARRVRAETTTVGWRRYETVAIAKRAQAGDAAGNVVVRTSVSLADILGAGFTPGVRAS